MARSRRELVLLVLFLSLSAGVASAQAPPTDRLLYGVAYYDEYMPYERLDQDVRMMKEVGINVVRIAESTWSTVEPQDGVFDFTHVDRVLDAMQRASISVIVGTPSRRSMPSIGRSASTTGATGSTAGTTSLPPWAASTPASTPSSRGSSGSR